jgi:hypothetical protein
MPWAAGDTPQASHLVATLAGHFCAADLRPALGATTAGAVLVWVDPANPRYLLHRLRLASAEDVVRVEPLVELPLPAGAAVTQAQVRVAEAGQMHALLLLAQAGAQPQWSLWSEDRGWLALPEAIAASAGLVSLLFLHGTRPALLWVDPHAGLRVHPVDPPREPLPIG